MKEDIPQEYKDIIINIVNKLLSDTKDQINKKTLEQFVDYIYNSINREQLYCDYKNNIIYKGSEPFLFLTNNLKTYRNALKLNYNEFYNINEKNIKTLFLVGNNYNYILGPNAIFEEEKTTKDIYTYYEYNNEGLYKNIYVNKKLGLMLETIPSLNLKRTYRINKVNESEINVINFPIRCHDIEELINFIYQPIIYDKTNCYLETKTSVGKRMATNEDSPIALSHPTYPNIKLLAVADGIGGYNNGKLASELAINELKEWFLNLDSNIKYSSYLANKLKAIVLEINEKIINLGFSKGKMGSTLTCALILDEKTIIVNVGDSRCYSLKDKEMKQLTEDDSEAYRYYKMNIFSKDEIRYYKYNNKITKYLGMDNLDPVVKVIGNYTYDKLLLLTDGVTDCLSDDKIKVIANTSKKEDILKNIIDEAVNKEQERPKLAIPLSIRKYPLPGEDNATGVILVKK